MQPSDLKPFAKLLADVMAYYGKDVSAFTQTTFWTACLPFSFEQVQKAFSAHACDPEEGRFAPKVAHLLKVLQGTRTDRAALAWGKALEAMQRVGAWADVVFDDPAIHAAVEDLGGWPKLCRTPSDELSYTQHRFCELHRAYTGRGTFEYPRRLAGARDSNEVFQKFGVKLPEPVLVGSPERCRLVYEAGSSVGKTQITTSSMALLGVTTVRDALRLAANDNNKDRDGTV